MLSKMKATLTLTMWTHIFNTTVPPTTKASPGQSTAVHQIRQAWPGPARDNKEKRYTMLNWEVETVSAIRNLLEKTDVEYQNAWPTQQQKMAPHLGIFLCINIGPQPKQSNDTSNPIQLPNRSRRTQTKKNLERTHLKVFTYKDARHNLSHRTRHLATTSLINEQWQDSCVGKDSNPDRPSHQNF